MNGRQEGRAAVFQNGGVEVAHMRVTHGRCDATIGDDAADKKTLDAALAQHPFKSRHVEGRIRDFLDGQIGRMQYIHELMPPSPRLEVTLLEERPELLEMGRDQRLASFCWHQGKLC